MSEDRVVNGRGAVAVLVYLGLVLQLVQVGVIPLLPVIGKSLHIDPGQTSWLVTASLLSGAICLAVLSRLADLIGKRTVIVACLVLTLAGSVLGWAAHGFVLLVISRALMGAAFPMLALPEAIAADTMERERAHSAIGLIHAGAGLGIAAGLLIGSLAGAGDASWRVFFAVCAIASVAAIGATLRFVSESPVRAGGRLDVTGAGLLSIGLIGLLLALGEGSTWGWSSAATLVLGIGAIVVLVVWWQAQRRSRQPLIDVAYLTRRDVRLPYAIYFLIAFGIYGALTAVSRIAQTPTMTGYGYGYGVLHIAWYAVPQALGGIAGAMLVRRLARHDRVVEGLAFGASSILISFIVFGLFTRSPGASLIGLGLDSLGLSAGLAAGQIVVVRSVAPQESGIALGLTIVLYAVGNTAGSAVLGVLLTNLTIAHTPLPTLAAYHWGFAVSGAAAALALLLCLPLLGRRRPASSAAGVSASARPASAGTP